MSTIAWVAAVLVEIANEHRVRPGQKHLIAKHRTAEALGEAYDSNPQAAVGRGTDQNVGAVGRDAERTQQGLHLPDNTRLEVPGVKLL